MTEKKKSKAEAIIEDIIGFLKVRWWAVILILFAIGIAFSGWSVKTKDGDEYKKEKIEIPFKINVQGEAK